MTAFSRYHRKLPDKKFATQLQAWKNHEPVATKLALQQDAKQSSTRWHASWKKTPHWDKYEWLSLQPIAREPLETILKSLNELFQGEMDWKKLYPMIEKHASDLTERSKTWKNAYKNILLFGTYDKSPIADNLQGLYVQWLAQEHKDILFPRYQHRIDGIRNIFFYLHRMQDVCTPTQWKNWKKQLQERSTNGTNGVELSPTMLQKIKALQKEAYTHDRYDDEFDDPYEQSLSSYYEIEERSSMMSMSYDDLYTTIRMAAQGDNFAFSRLSLAQSTVPITAARHTDSRFLNLDEDSDKFGWTEKQASNIGKAIFEHWMLNGYTHGFFETLDLIVKYHVPVEPLIEKYGLPEYKYNSYSPSHDKLIKHLYALEDTQRMIPFACQILSALSFSELSSGARASKWAYSVLSKNKELLQDIPSVRKGYILLQVWEYHQHDWMEQNGNLGHLYRYRLSDQEALEHWLNATETNRNVYQLNRTNKILFKDTPWVKFLKDHYPEVNNIYELIVNDTEQVVYNRTMFMNQSNMLLEMVIKHAQSVDDSLELDISHFDMDIGQI